jgi:CPA1 family monovalent cation:H+ antiporter
MHSIFHLFSALLLLAAVFGYINHRFLHLPRTIGMLIGALTLSVGLIVWDNVFPGDFVRLWAKQLLEQASFPAALLNGALSFLLFAAALSVKFDDAWQRKGTIAVLATAGVLLSTFLMGGAMWLVFGLAGLSVPLVWALVLGAITAPTDPIAVSAALERVGLPATLRATISGESLLNDGVGVLMYALLVGIAAGGKDFSATNFALLFVYEAAGGALLGLATGWLAYRAMRSIDQHDVEIMITFALVTVTYSIAEVLGLSGPIAVVIAGVLVGGRARKHAMSDKTRLHIDVVWSVIDEVLNSLLFLLIGLEIVVVEGNVAVLLAAAAAAVLSLVVRFASVAPLAFLLSRLKVRTGATVLLTWAGLRGGISIALALALPESDYRQIILASVYGVVLFTILVQGLTLERVADYFFRRKQEA